MIGALRRRFLARDLRRRPAATVAVTVLVAISALLMSTGALVAERIVGSVDRLFAQAKPPHFLQMHTGEINHEVLTAFAEAHPGIQSWLVEDLVDIEGSRIVWTRQTDAAATPDATAPTRTAPARSGDLSDSLVDHLFVTQNTTFDFLLDTAGAVSTPAAGEVFVPVSIQSRYGLRAGDELRVGPPSSALTLRIAGAVRDAQMASSFASSTRFLVSSADFAALRATAGAPESIVEFRLHDPSTQLAFQRDYEAAPGLPRNGQAITFDTIRALNAISDGLVAAALMFASLVMIAIAFVALRLVIRSALEDDVREIGALRAIGIDRRTIAGLFLTKYRFLTLVGCAIGGALSPVAAGVVSAGIEANFGTAETGVASVAAVVGALAVVSLLVAAICRGMLRRIGRIEPVRALVHGSTLTQRVADRRAHLRRHTSGRSRLVPGQGFSLTTRVAAVGLRAQWRGWMLLPIVVALATLLVTLPSALLSTLESARFVTYLGAPASDLRADLRGEGDDLRAAHRRLVESLRADDRLTTVRSFVRVSAEARAADAAEAGPDAVAHPWQSLSVEVGDTSSTALAYVAGARPAAGEIALSVLAADQHGVTVGDRLRVRAGDATTDAVVSGVYQDITSGGRTAKLHDPTAPSRGVNGETGYIIYADAAATADPVSVAADLAVRHPAASIIPMQEYMRQTLSFATSALRHAVVVALGFALGVVALLTALALTLFLARDRRDHRLLRTLGFSGREVGRVVRVQALTALAAGVVLGAVVSASLGGEAVGAAISALGVGITRLTLTPDPLLVWVAYPGALVAAGAAATLVLTRRARLIDTTGERR